MRNSLAPLLAALAVFFCAAPAVGAPAVAADSTAVTTVVIVRHAEKSATQLGDVSLSALGLLRARELARLLGDSGIDTIVVTPYLRNRQTAQPLADRLGDSLLVIDAIDETVRRVRGPLAGRRILLVGHSNTVPQLVEALAGVKVEPFGEDEFDRLYVITLAPGRAPALLRLGYGATRTGRGS